MADQKITARVALTTGVDPLSDVLPIVDISAGASGSKKITINDLFAGWGMTPAGAALVKATDVQAQRVALGVNQIYYNPAINGLTGGGPTKLDGVPTVNLAAGTVQILYIGESLHFYKLLGDSYGENSPVIIVPDDYAPTVNEKAWRLADAEFVSIVASRLDASTSISAPMVTVISGPASSALLSQATEERMNTLPNFSGILGLEPIVEFVPVTSGYTIYAGPYIDRTFILEPTSAVTPVNLSLPGWDETRIGQRVSFISDFAAAVFNVSVFNGGALMGPALTALAANTWYEYACKSITGTVATWKRIR